MKHIRINRIHNPKYEASKHASIMRIIGIGINILSIMAISAHWGGGVMAIITAALITLIVPPLAAIFAFFAAINTWGWPWYLALLVFLWPIVFLILGVGILGSVFLWVRQKNAKYRSKQPEDDTIDVDYSVVDENNKEK